ncbi:MAG: hypothetical protein BZ137_00600 [Methanosphaera sp. rholeuAM130]|nr:MAG: hypothetical protein BZ137_00600 [Methanosphaera sp. rholeuAM130]
MSAGVDVVLCEPMDRDNPLLDAKNIMITPHMAWASVESRQRLVHEIAENFRAYLNDEKRNVVN